MIKRVIIVICIVFLGTGVVYAQDVEPGSIVERIQERGELICGVNWALPGFGVGETDDAISRFLEVPEGFDVDICRAVAAAILGDADAVRYIPLAAADRPIALATGQVDMISRNTTWTLTRNTQWRAIFGPTTFYDGQGIMVHGESGLSTLEDLSGEPICVAAGTTTELNMREQLEIRGLDANLISETDTPTAFESFENGICTAFTTDLSGLASFKASADNGDSYIILDIVLSKEPLGPLSPDSDPRFAEIIAWTVWGLIQAEEFGITSENVATFRDSENQAIRRFLGTGTESSGDFLGIPNDFMFQVISQVGNYGEIFERHLGRSTPLGLDRGLNALWTDGGLLYSPPFR